MKTLDCRGLACPKPVIMTKKELEISNTDIQVIVDNEAAKENVSKFARNSGYELDIKENGGLYHIEIFAGKAPETRGLCEINEFIDKNLILLVSSNLFGSGDDKLGALLMKSYLYALTESDDKPQCILFVNSGVKLTTEGSDTIESLRVLEKSGVEILSCGTCLDFYGLKEKLLIGSVTNMYTLVEKMNKSTKTIKL